MFKKFFEKKAEVPGEVRNYLQGGKNIGTKINFL